MQGKKKQKKIILVAIAHIFLCYKYPLFANEIPTDWYSTRSLGLGGAGTASINDETSIFINPAGLARSRNPKSKQILHQVRMPLPDEFVVNTLMTNKIGADPSHWFDESASAAKEHPGRISSFSIQSFPNVILGSKKSSLTLLLGAPIKSDHSVVFTDPNNLAKAYVRATNTFSGAIGLGFSLFNGQVKFGLSARPNYRSDYENNNYDTTDTSKGKYLNEIQSNSIHSTAVALDAGIMFTVADLWYPTLGFSVQNIPTGCASNYTHPITKNVITLCGTRRSGSNNAPETSRVDPTEARMGVSLTPRFRVFKSILNVNLSADITPIPISVSNHDYYLSENNQSSIIHAGSAIYFGNSLQQKGLILRGGFQNGASTWGTSMNLAFLRLQYSSFVVKTRVTMKNKSIVEDNDRRHMLSLIWYL